jgi:hypothetical protein
MNSALCGWILRACGLPPPYRAELASAKVAPLGEQFPFPISRVDLHSRNCYDAGIPLNLDAISDLLPTIIILTVGLNPVTRRPGKILMLNRNVFAKQISIAAVIIGMTLNVAIVSAADRNWSRSEIFAIADNEGQRLGYNIEQMSVSFDIYNSEWRSYLKSLTADGGMPDVEEKLKGLQYWAVYYAPLKMTFGGDLWVFIDKGTGKIITVIQGK